MKICTSSPQIGGTTHHVLLCIKGSLSLESLLKVRGISGDRHTAATAVDDGVPPSSASEAESQCRAVTSLHTLGRLAVRSIAAFSRLMSIPGHGDDGSQVMLH